MIRYMVRVKTLSPFNLICGPFHCWYCCVFTKWFRVEEVQSVDFFFCYLCLSCPLRELITKRSVMKALFPSRRFKVWLLHSAHWSVLSQFFSLACSEGPAPFFCTWTSSVPSAICQRPSSPQWMASVSSPASVTTHGDFILGSLL